LLDSIEVDAGYSAGGVLESLPPAENQEDLRKKEDSTILVLLTSRYHYLKTPTHTTKNANCTLHLRAEFERAFDW